MRVALGQVPALTDDYITYAQQLGVSSIHLNTPALPGSRRWEVADLLALRQRAEAAGLRLEAIENVPNSFYMDAMLGGPGRDEEIENFAATIRNFGEAGIPLLGYHFFPAQVWRTSQGPDGRGGAIVTGYDHAIALDPERQDELLVSRREKAQDDPFVRGAKYETDRVLDDDAMWANYEYFIKAVIPVAEEAGVRLCLHPDDPPVPTLGGIARLFRSIDGLRRGREIASSPAWALDLCLGTRSEMGGEADGPGGDRARSGRRATSRMSTCATSRAPCRRSTSASSARATTTRPRSCARLDADGLRRLPDRRPRAADARRHAVLPPRSRPRCRATCRDWSRRSPACAPDAARSRRERGARRPPWSPGSAPASPYGPGLELADSRTSRSTAACRSSPRSTTPCATPSSALPSGPVRRSPRPRWPRASASAGRRSGKH